jgi:phosphoglycolate phosphatase
MSKRVKFKRRSRRQAVIFDFDGTIADSFEYVFDFLKREAGNTQQYSDAERGLLRKMPMKDLALHLGVPVWRLPLTYFRGRRVMRAHMEHVKPFPGMIELIRQLHQDDEYDLFITSANSGHNIRHLLRDQGVLSCFRAIRSSAGITGKPALINQLLVRYRLPRRGTWYVGDEVGDVRAARRAGVGSLAVTWGFADPIKLKAAQPSQTAAEPTEIARIVRKTWKK